MLGAAKVLATPTRAVAFIDAVESVGAGVGGVGAGFLSILLIIGMAALL
jgi:hypothetical protein